MSAAMVYVRPTAFDNGHKFNLWNKRIVKLYLNLMAYYHTILKKCKLLIYLKPNDENKKNVRNKINIWNWKFYSFFLSTRYLIDILLYYIYKFFLKKDDYSRNC